MVGKSLELLFIRSWVLIKLNLLFLFFSVCGLFIFGIGPALKVINELFIAHEFNHQEITLKEGWVRFKQNFVRGNILFALFLFVLSLLAYNLYLSVQLQGIFFLIIDFVLIFAVFYAFVTFQYSLLLDGYYAISPINLLKLSVISSFASFSQFLKIVVGVTVILLITWKFKGLFLFGTISFIQVWCYLMTRKWRITIDERLGLHV